MSSEGAFGGALMCSADKSIRYISAASPGAISNATNTTPFATRLARHSLAEKYTEEGKKVKFGRISLSSRRIMEKAKQLLKGEVADSMSIINEEEIVPGEANKIGEGFIGGRDARKPTWAERGGDTTKRRKGGGSDADADADEESGLKEEPKDEAKPEKFFFGLF